MNRFRLWWAWRVACVNTYLSGWSMDDDETYRRFICTEYRAKNVLDDYDLNVSLSEEML